MTTINARVSKLESQLERLIKMLNDYFSLTRAALEILLDKGAFKE
jgi:hypothetical protein